jgi:hypothetical protein
MVRIGKVVTSERPDLPLSVMVGAGGMGMAIPRRLGPRHRLFLADANRLHKPCQALREMVS